MPKCKHCKEELTPSDKRKSWILKGAIRNPETGKPYVFRIDLYDCPICGHTTRIATRIEE